MHKKIDVVAFQTRYYRGTVMLMGNQILKKLEKKLKLKVTNKGHG